MTKVRNPQEFGTSGKKKRSCCRKREDIKPRKTDAGKEFSFINPLAERQRKLRDESSEVKEIDPEGPCLSHLKGFSSRGNNRFDVIEKKGLIKQYIASGGGEASGVQPGVEGKNWSGEVCRGRQFVADVCLLEGD